MDFVSRYTAHLPDAQGMVVYSDDEHAVWRALFERQQRLLPQRACNEFIEGLARLHLCGDAIPQLPEVSRRLYAATGWTVEPVQALISARAFFSLLADKKFPAATFIRSMAELDYVTEPDIFHELFGHCPMLTDPVYADFLHRYACQVLQHPESDWRLLQRLFWFTVEFGLINTSQGVRAYGGGILSSMSETAYCVESDKPLRVLFEPASALRTPYRIDSLQSIYFVIQSFDKLYECVTPMMHANLKRARELGEYPALFPVDEGNPHIHILAC